MLRRTVTAAVVAGLAASGALAAPAYAAKSWSPIAGLEGTKLQACKQSVDGDTWRVFLRVNARQGETRVKTTVTLKKPGPDKVWRTGWVEPGDVVTGSRTAPKGAGVNFEYSMGADGMGGGGSGALAGVGRC